MVKILLIYSCMISSAENNPASSPVHEQEIVVRILFQNIEAVQIFFIPVGFLLVCCSKFEIIFSG